MAWDLVGARLPIVQGTSFAFIPIMIPLVPGRGVDALPALFGSVLIGGLFHIVIGTFIGKIRFALPPLVTGLVVTMIGLALVKVGIQYAAGGVPAINSPEYGSLLNWSAALVVVFVTLTLKFYTKGMMAVSALVIGIGVGYVYAIAMGMLMIEGIPIEVLGGVIVMFGMVVAAGVSMLSDVKWNRRNMVIFAIALSIGLVCNLIQKQCNICQIRWVS